MQIKIAILAAGILIAGLTPAFAGPAPTAQSIKDQALASEGYTRALGKIDQDQSRAPIDPDSWDRIDMELRTVGAPEIGPDGRMAPTDPNLRNQYIVITMKAKHDLYIEVSQVLKTSVIRPITKAGDTTIIVADVTPSQKDGNWTVQIEWRNRLPGGLPRNAYPNSVLVGTPEEEALKEKAQRLASEAMARSMAESEKQAAYNKIAEEARKTALASIAKANADDVVALKATLEPLLGKWIPYTRIDYRADGEPESEYRALRVERIADGKGQITLLTGSEPTSPKVQVPFTLENGTFAFKDENCSVSIRPARDNGRIYMLFGTRECYSMQQQVAIVPEERDIAMLDLRRVKGATKLSDPNSARVVSPPRIDGTKLESVETMSPETLQRNRNSTKMDLPATPMTNARPPAK